MQGTFKANTGYDAIRLSVQGQWPGQKERDKKAKERTEIGEGSGIQREKSDDRRRGPLEGGQTRNLHRGQEALCGPGACSRRRQSTARRGAVSVDQKPQTVFGFAGAVSDSDYDILARLALRLVRGPGDHPKGLA